MNCAYIIIYCCGQIPPKLAAIYYLVASGDQESRYGLTAYLGLKVCHKTTVKVPYDYSQCVIQI